MDINNRVGIHNRFDIEVIDAKTGEVKQKARAFNVICNRLWSRLITLSGGSGYFTYIHYGSGSGTPAATDTSLFHFEGYKNITADFDSYSTNFNTGVTSLRRKVILDENTAVGVNITEVGIADGTSASNLCTHAMLQDMNRNPISIAKTGTDIINIYATVFLHWDNTGDIKITNLGDGYYSSSYPSRGRVIRRWLLGLYAPSSSSQDSSYIYPQYIGAYKSAYFGNLGGDGSGDVDNQRWMWGSGNKATVTMDLSTKTFRAVFNRAPATDTNNPNMNDGGIMRLVFISAYENNIGSWQSSYQGDANAPAAIEVECGGTVIPPSRITNETVGTGDGVNTKFKTKFDFPYNATVYINGNVVNSGVTIKRAPRAVTQDKFHRYVNRVHNQSDANNVIPIAGVITTYKSSISEVSFDNGVIYENKCYEIGISRVSVRNAKMYGSDDCENWTELASSTSSTLVSVDLPVNQQRYKFFKCVYTASSNAQGYMYFNTYDGNNIIFDTPPANGDVITIDYTTPCIPKDENHVLDVSFSITFGEWTGE